MTQSSIPRTIMNKIMHLHRCISSYGLIMVLALLCFPNNRASAQSASADEFPIGGLTFGLNEPATANGMAEFGLNAIFYRTRKGIAAMPEGTRGILDARGYFLNFVGGAGRYPTFDFRYFMIPQNAPGRFPNYQYDTDAGWTIKRGAQDQVHPLEWRMEPGDADANGYYLKDMRTVDLPVDGVYRHGFPSDLGKYSREFYIDFIYRLKASDYVGVPGNTNLFELIPQWVRTTEVVDPVTLKKSKIIEKTNIFPLNEHHYITLDDYNNYVALDSEDADISKFPTPGYAVYRIPITIPSEWYHDGVESTVDMVASVGLVQDEENKSQTSEFSGAGVDLAAVLVNNEPADRGIYVRGVRMRTQQAEDLFSGRLDNLLKARFQDIRNELTRTDGGYQGVAPVWDKIKQIGLANESQGPGFRALAYCDRLWRKWTSERGGEKNMTLILAHPFANAYTWLRAIYWDAYGIIPTTQL